MGPGSLILNVGRGGHLVEADLLEALAQGRPGFAWLDVFDSEPLAEDHPFWRHPSITITPHVASLTNPASVARQIVSNYRRLLDGEPLVNTVDLARGY
jgi:glyoxylate/hydroxypyruvate reductase A